MDGLHHILIAVIIILLVWIAYTCYNYPTELTPTVGSTYVYPGASIWTPNNYPPLRSQPVYTTIKVMGQGTANGTPITSA
jgi:hypothetical protein